MLRITESASAAGAKTYYTEGLTRQDYYSQGQEITGHWHGRGASLLGLSGPVDQRSFFALCDNQDPRTGDTLTVRQKSNRRVGYDFTFSAPKSVGILYAMSGDTRILDAFRASVDETMQELEAETKARVRKQGADSDRVTGNLIWTDFTHFTTRPVDGAPDPDLHAHCFAFNATWDDKERRWKAAQFGDIKRDASYYEAAFHARLAARMDGLGFGVERHGKWWDVAGIERGLIEKFSLRTAEIEAKAASLGITDADAKGALGAKTRNRKAKDLGMEELRAEWRERLSAADRLAIERVLGGATENSSANFGEKISVDGAMAYAIEASFERASVVSDKQLREAALRRGVGSVLPEDLSRAAIRAGVLSRTIDGRELVTTREVLGEEKAMLAFAREGRGACRPLARTLPVMTSLNEGQRTAVEHVLGSMDRVILVEGGAGTGKTTMIRTVREGIETSGRKVFAFAPSAEAARQVLRSEGFAEAETVARLLVDTTLQERMRGQVMLVDEAGMLGVRTMHSVFTLAEKLDCRVILSGDTKQHASVERGDALRLLMDKAGLEVAEVRDIVRQSGEYREAVAAIGRGDIGDGFGRLDRLGWIEEVASEDRHRRLAEDYLATLRQGRTALVISPTHREGDQVTSLIREELKREGRVGPFDERVDALQNLSWTAAERGDSGAYRAGLAVQFFKDAPGIRKGERLVVERKEEGRVVARKADSTFVNLPLDRADRFQVYEPYVLGLAAGDRVRITQNGMTADGVHKLATGNLFEVKGFTSKGDIELDNGWIVGRHYGHLAHGYCTTSHASQGKTVDQVLIAQGTASLGAASQEQFYVSVSRARQGARIYTDSKAELLDAVAKSSRRGSASELAEGELEAKRMQPREIEAVVRRIRAHAERYLTQSRREEYAAHEQMGMTPRAGQDTAKEQAPQAWERDDGPAMDR